ncbi:MAG TPA: 3-phosphoshikimate 1-carboxyvinyltransferase [Clostridiaceae bacterium]|nr:3-phosphoshikimate 1-carboxyvinyltransferase [Clostridiaceae bacterium]
MKYLRIRSKPLNGKVFAQPSKSMAHRAVICAALAKGESRIDNVVLSDDIKATLGAAEVLGAKVRTEDSPKYKGRKLVVIESEGQISIRGKYIDCRESGSTARFLMPITRLVPDPVVFTGSGRLVERPFDIYKDLFEQKGISWSDLDGKMPINLSGKLVPGEYRLKGDISSQFISGLLFALPLLEDSSRIEITGKIESLPYIQMTINVLKDFGIDIVTENDFRTLIIEGNQSYRAMPSYTVEGDWSQAAFFCVIGALSGPVTIEGLNMDSLQGDKVIVDILKNMGAQPVVDDKSITFDKTELTGVTVDVSQCPDLVPAIALAASAASGVTDIVNGARLRIKESDRLSTTCNELGKLGARITEKPDGLVIRGVKRLNGGRVYGSGDHRIVMALASASVICDTDVEIEGYDAVKKSYPEFWEDFLALGGKVEYYG